MKLKSILVGLTLAFISTSLTQAHAFLDHSDPAVGSTVSGSPAVVKIWFSEDLENSLSKIEVFDQQSHQVDQKDSKVDAKETNLLIVSLHKLTPGTYKVVWHAVSADTHHTTGTFSFTVE